MSNFKLIKHVWLICAVIFVCDQSFFAQESVLVTDIQYYHGEGADEKKHKLDLYMPAGVDRPPLIIWVHGGAWALGDRKNEKAVSEAFNAHGIAVAAISYRLSPGEWIKPELKTGVQHPEHVRDAVRAFAFMHQHAERYGCNHNKIVISGFSAGAVVAAQMALDPIYLAEVGMSINDLYASIPIAGAYDLVSYYHSIKEEMGEEVAEQHVKVALGNTFEDLAKASPINYVQNSKTPMLVVSETDTYDYTALFEKRVIENESPFIDFHHVKDLNHAGLYNNLKSVESAHLKKMASFIQSISTKMDK